jgi:glycosyltransferase involved in cell wall biosynthesis
MKNETVSVIIPWCDRPELAESVRRNRDAFRKSNADVIVVNCGGDPNICQRCVATCPQSIRMLNLPVQFNKSLALNIGAKASSRDVLMLLDADVAIPDDFFSLLLRHYEAGFCVTVEQVFESDIKELRTDDHTPHAFEIAHYFEFVNAGGKKVTIETQRQHLPSGSRSGPGLLLVSRREFIEVGGMNSRLEGWGWEDIDLLVRLELLLGTKRRQAAWVTHIRGTHAQTTYQKASSQELNFRTCLANYSSSILEGTFTHDIQKWGRKAKWQFLDRTGARLRS